MKKEQSSVSNQKVILPNKELVGVKKEIDESSKLPNPTGWRILVLPFKQKEKTKGGILLADETVERSQVASTCGLVLRMGPGGEIRLLNDDEVLATVENPEDIFHEF
jgi:hypothetical protein